jgi:hypothetical protein
MPLVDAVSDQKIDYVCASCGYGVAVSTPPPTCPMCRGAEWDKPVWRPFTSLAEYRVRFEIVEEERLAERKLAASPR